MKTKCSVVLIVRLESGADGGTDGARISLISGASVLAHSLVNFAFVPSWETRERHEAPLFHLHFHSYTKDLDLCCAIAATSSSVFHFHLHSELLPLLLLDGESPF